VFFDTTSQARDDRPMMRTSERGKYRAWVGPVLAAVLTLTCGGSDSGGSPCQTLGNAICAKACACTDGAGCALTDGTGGTLTYDTEADCRGFQVTLACSGGSGYNDAAACLPLVQAATCTGTGTEASLVYPTDNACGSP